MEAETRKCALEGCDVSFETRDPRKRFCTKKHADLSRNRKPATTVGVPTVPPAADELSDVELTRSLEQRGFVVHRPRPPVELTDVVDLSGIEGEERIRLAVVSCTHFGSKYQQLTHLREFCKYAIDQGAQYFVHGGDVEDGPQSRHRNPQELFLHTFGSIADYVAEQLPSGLPWKMISGNHDDWWTLDGGPDMIEAIARRRDDVEYIGKSLAYLQLGDVRIEVFHANDGGSKQPSLKLRQHLESLSPAMKPNILLLGNYHKHCTAFHRNVLGIQLASFQAQSSWMAGRSLVSEVGGIIVDVGTSAKGLSGSAKFEIVSFYEPREDDF